MASIVECSEVPVALRPRDADVSWMVPIYVAPPGFAARENREPAKALLPMSVTAIVPVYNERESVVATIRGLRDTLASAVAEFEIIVVNDGSTDGTGGELARFEHDPGIRILSNERNRGYGFSIKRAAAEAMHETIVITDADGSYPISRIPDLLRESQTADMIVGARIGADAAIPTIRRPAKWCLRKLATYLTATDIPDLNSGLRVMKRSLVRRFLPLLPDGFSLTTTITLAAITHDYRVRYLPISYAKRIGQSSIRPVRDTINFVNLIVRTVLYFKPLKIFAPASAALFGTALIVALVSKFWFGQLADVTSVTLAVAAFQVLAIGLLADLIEKRSPVYSAHGPEARVDSRPAAKPFGTVSALRKPTPATADPSGAAISDGWHASPQDRGIWSGYTFAAEPADPALADTFTG